MFKFPAKNRLTTHFEGITIIAVVVVVMVYDDIVVAISQRIVI